MTYVLPAPEAEMHWLAERTGWVFTDRARAIKAIDGQGRTLGMVGYDEWTPNACRAHMAVEKPIVWRRLLGPAFAYPFVECGKGIVLAVIAGNNTKSLALTENFGFTRVAEIQDGWAKGVPLVTFQMRKEDCRFLRAPHG